MGYASVGGGGGSGGYQEHAQAKETPSSHGIAPGDPMDRAVDDIFSCARHNRLDEVRHSGPFLLNSFRLRRTDMRRFRLGGGTT